MAHGILHRLFGRLIGLDSNLNLVIRGRYIYFGDDNGLYPNGVFDLTSVTGSVPLASVTAVIPAGPVDNYTPVGYVGGQTNRLILTPTDGTSVIVGIPEGTDGWEMRVYCDPNSALPVKLQGDSSAGVGSDIFVGAEGNTGIYDIAPGQGITLEWVATSNGWLVNV